MPVAGIIRKPLLALILQHTFQFEPAPSEDGNGNGVLVELFRDLDDDDQVILYSPSLILTGAFSARDLRNQKMKISSSKPSSSEPGREVKIICAMNPPADLERLQNTCEEVLQDGGWNCNMTGDHIQSIFLGKPMKNFTVRRNEAS